ncbi:MAG: hypothetical protein ABW321_35330 [Polyangiales bacterium]
MDVFEWDEWGLVSAIALLAWVPFTFWLFSVERPVKAAAHSLVWSMMWLPEGAAFDLPALPPFHKYSIAAISVLLGLWWKAPKRLKAARIGRGYDWILLVMMLGQIGTVLTNPDPLHYGTYKTIDLPGFKPYDGLSAAVRVLISIGIPCMIGRAMLRTRRDLIDVMEVLVIGGLIYSLPIFYELRMSPMLHENLYGFAPRSDWSQNMRAGGYRATVFMGHGLVVGFFMFLSTTCAIALRRAGKRRIWGVPMGFVIAYLGFTLLFCKAAAAVMYGAAAYVVIRYMGSKLRTRVYVLLAVVVISYPLSRMFEFFPTTSILSAAETLGPDRVQSLQFRFDNEDILLLKASERMWFGWGGFSREHVYDSETAKDLVIQDGHWIAEFGMRGLVGFCCYFALMLLPVLRAPDAMRKVRLKRDQALLGGLGFMVVICSVNMLPNMELPTLQFVFAAGLAVLMKELPRQAAAEITAANSGSQLPPPKRTRRPIRRGLQSAA